METVRRITYEILRVKGLRKDIRPAHNPNDPSLVRVKSEPFNLDSNKYTIR